jgi:hypothetical protein
MLVARHLPQQLDVRERARDQHDIARAIAENPVSDVNVATLCVLGWSFHGFLIAANFITTLSKASSQGQSD